MALSTLAKKGNLVRFNTPSVGSYVDMHGTNQIIIEEQSVCIMLNYSPINLCEIFLYGDVIFNIDPDCLDDMTMLGTAV